MKEFYPKKSSRLLLQKFKGYKTGKSNVQDFDKGENYEVSKFFQLLICIQACAEQCNPA